MKTVGQKFVLNPIFEYCDLPKPDRGHREGGLTAPSKNFKTPLFKRY